MSSSWLSSSFRPKINLGCLNFRNFPTPKPRFSQIRLATQQQPRDTATRLAARKIEMEQKTKEDYQNWTHESLVQRVMQLEEELKRKNKKPSPPVTQKPERRPKEKKEFDPSKYSTRLIALKLAYLGKNYNGFEHHSNNTTPLPTIEEELWKALNKAKLIFPTPSRNVGPGEMNWEGCEYSKCGRTDKGVSAFGQVIGIRVRSNRPLPKPKTTENSDQDVSPTLENHTLISKEQDAIQGEENEEAVDFDPIADEIPYPSVLNRLLPPSIRILAWCPNPPPDFSARFSCRERQYRYFFTNPAFPPLPSSFEVANQTTTPSPRRMKDGWLDIEAMREAAKMFEGLHDFRNFCKVDPGKQISNFERRIFHADIVPVKDVTGTLGYLNKTEFRNAGAADVVGVSEPTEQETYPQVWAFTLHGSAFLWHQVRHMIAVLFLVAQGLEKPSIIRELLDVEKNPRRPMYEMASDTPLVLWDCIFPDENDESRRDALEWHYVGDGPNETEAKFGFSGLVDNVWTVWRERKIDEILAGGLMQIVASQGRETNDLAGGRPWNGRRSQKVFEGGNKARQQGTYLPVMKKPRLESVEVINERYLARKGFENATELRDHHIQKAKNRSQPEDE